MRKRTRRLLCLGLLAPAAAGCADPRAPSVVYKHDADRIIAAARTRNDAYAKLAHLCDRIGHRLSGSPQLEQAVAWAQEAMICDGHENVRAEPVMVPRWIRGDESVALIEPYERPLRMLGLGGSVGTPPQGLRAEVLVVEDEAGLAAAGERARGRIVLFNNAMPPYDPRRGSGYGTAVRFRHKGARLAAEQGAVGCLIRSVTANSLYTPHTGAMSYDGAPRKIPAAALTIEDAMLLARLAAAGQRVVVELRMQARDDGEAPSANVVGELRGRSRPNEIVVIGGHIDSWDVGQGAHDDAAGCVMAMEAISVLRRLGLVPRRTIRVVLFTNEENGLAGAKKYAEDHAAELPHHVAAIESDSGAFRPTGFSYEVNDPQRQQRAGEQLADIVRLLEPLGPMRVRAGGSGADIGAMKPAGVALLGLNVAGETYFNYHHTEAVTLDKVDPRDLSDATAALAVMAYVLADMPDRLGEP